MFKVFRKQVLSVKELATPENLLKVINTIQQNISDTTDNMARKVQSDSIILTNISLKSGNNNIINHTLSRKLTGWKIVRQRAEARIWDTQDSNPSPNLTLWLSTGADVIVDIEVF